jgi:subtilisin-like proprotein convertase family protein
VYRALTELDRTRPRLVAFAPEEALKRVMARPDVRHHLGARGVRQPAPARFALARPWRDAEWHRPERRASRQGAATAAMRILLVVAIALGTLAATLMAGAGAPAFAGASHRERHDGHGQEIFAQAKRKGSKTVKKSFTSSVSVDIPVAEAIFDDGPADPYPTTIAVSGFKKAKLTDVNVTFRGFAHNFPKDVNVLLVAPGGRNAVVLGDVGGTSVVADLTVTLDDEATALLSGDGILTSGSFQPLANDPLSAVDFPAPAPALSENVALSTFDGINPNGAWQLFIVDDGQGDAGSLADGWSLQITAKAKTKGKKKH